MLKRFGVLALTLASLGAMAPVSAVAAERGRDDHQVVTNSRDDRSRFNEEKMPQFLANDRVQSRVNDRSVIVKHVAVQRERTRATCR